MIKVGILRGGPSNEFDISLKTGESVLDNLPDKFDLEDILIDKEGNWSVNGKARSLLDISRSFDVVFNCLHGFYGEDGKVQRSLDSLSIPYTGSKALGSALAMNKALAKRTYINNGIRVPSHNLLTLEDDLEKELFQIFRSCPIPLIVKPVNNGSSLGTNLAYSFDDLRKRVDQAFKYSDTVMIEEFIQGREATCGVLENFRGEEIYSFFPVEIVKPQHSNFFDYNAKYNGESQEIVPGRFSDKEKKEIQELAKKAHKALGLRHYSRSDFIVSPKGVFILETNTLPGLTKESLYPKSIEAVGLNFSEFLEHLINLALKGK
jgi:D-alanine-D-alanine ligase